ncbi:acyl-CoA dehydrogenase family protein [Ignavibacterium sp.]|uniref:acyl-CoA dehydrogenase family protein n=1 Tax=Ignavibacterium sp. TaxID=2651167 RepID=UPI00307FB1A0
MIFEFKFTDEQNMLRETVRDFTNKEIKPIASRIDQEGKIPEELIRKMAELGFLGISFKEEYGGGGFGEVGYCIMQEEIARGCMSTATFIGAHQSIGTNAIFIGGTEEQKKKFIPPLAAGEKIAAFGLTEAQAGSDSFHLKTHAELDGDEWVINGEKLWITNGEIANIISLFARTEKGITLFAVETDRPGFKAGPPEKKMGIRGSVTNALSFENVRVPKENLIGQEGRGFIYAMKTLDAGRLGLGAACLGVSKELLELSTKYAKERVQFDHPIAQFQAIQFMLAEMAVMIYNMESIVYRTAVDFDLNKDISRQSAMVKYYCSESLDIIVDYAVQIHGGMGYSQELPIERIYRDSRINRIFEGTNEIQKGIIAREIIKKSGRL